MDDIEYSLSVIWDDVYKITDSVYKLYYQGETYLGIDNCNIILAIGRYVSYFIIDNIILVKSSTDTVLIDKNTMAFKEYRGKQYLPYIDGSRAVVLISKGTSGVDTLMVIKKDIIEEIVTVKSANYFYIKHSGSLVYREWMKGKQSDLITLKLND